MTARLLAVATERLRRVGPVVWELPADETRGMRVRDSELRRQLEADGIVVRCASNRGLAEEAPCAYTDVDRVVAVVEQAGLACRVARLEPIGVVKG